MIVSSSALKQPLGFRNVLLHGSIIDYNSISVNCRKIKLSLGSVLIGCAAESSEYIALVMAVNLIRSSHIILNEYTTFNLAITDGCHASTATGEIEERYVTFQKSTKSPPIGKS